MIFALLTLLSALSLAGVAGWFSIIGITAIYAAMPMHAVIMGVVLEGGKLVTTSWLYRNWEHATWKLRYPLIIFTIILMLATSIGVFGFLSKAHLEQGAGTVDNSAKVERLDQQIAREKSTITDNDKVIAQLDATVNSYIGKDRTDRSISVRKSQASQRAQLRSDSDASQKRIDGFSDDKLRLQSEVRKLQLDVGPIRYIAELIYGTEGNAESNIEAAVRMFTLLIVSTLDPLAVILLIAANHTILRLQNEKKEDKPFTNSDTTTYEPQTNTADETDIRFVSDAENSSPGLDAVHFDKTLDETILHINKHNEETSNIEESDIEGKKETEPLFWSPNSVSETGSFGGEDSYDYQEESQEKVAETGPISEEIQGLNETTLASTQVTWPNIYISKNINEEETPILAEIEPDTVIQTPSRARDPRPTQISWSEGEEEILADNKSETTIPTTLPFKIKSPIFDELVGYTAGIAGPHFIPKRLNEEKLKEVQNKEIYRVEQDEISTSWNSEVDKTVQSITNKIYEEVSVEPIPLPEDKELFPLKSSIVTEHSKTPKTLSWLREFKRT